MNPIARTTLFSALILKLLVIVILNLGILIDQIIVINAITHELHVFDFTVGL